MKKLGIMALVCVGLICTGCGEKIEDNSVLASTQDSGITEKANSVKDKSANDIVTVVNDEGYVELKFKNTNSDEYIRSLDGKKVTMTGYLSVLSPISGKFAYLMNMPYQSCPFCIPGTSAITNTLTIVAKENSKIEFTDLPVTVEGILETGNFTDDFGYEYGVRLKDVTVNKADVDALSDTIKQYNLLAENGVVEQIYNSIMTLDFSVFYDYYQLEAPQKVSLDPITATKMSLISYNSKGEYKKLVDLMDDLLEIGKNVNNDVEKNDYSNFNLYQNELQNAFYVFADWAAEGEL